MPDRTVLIFDGSFDGLLSAVFEAYTRRPMPVTLIEPTGQQQFGMVYESVRSDPAKAERVRRGIRRQMGDEAYLNVWKAFLSEHPERGERIYRYLRLGFQIKERLVRSLTDDRVIAVNKLAGLVSREASHLLQFVRLAETETGVYFGRISPVYPVLPIIMPHFAHRLNTQAFVIYDDVHRQAGLYDGRRWVVTDADEPHTPAFSADEQLYRRLWKTFYDAVEIRERHNPQLRQQLMPKKFWKNLTEMTENPAGDERSLLDRR